MLVDSGQLQQRNGAMNREAWEAAGDSVTPPEGRYPCGPDRRPWLLLRVLLSALLMLSVLPVVPAAAQRQDIYDVEPTLRDKQGDYTWFVPPSDINDLGYEGSFSFTLATGDSGDDELDNWAYWSFGSADGRYEVQAYIPDQWATAHPQYLIWADSDGDGSFANNYVAGPYLDQASGSGWRTIGEYDLSGDVRIEVRDVRARDDYRTVGVANARLAADAMRLKRVTQTFPPGAVELTSVDYEVTNRSNGSGRVVWGRVQEATSYDLDVTVGVENISDGRTDEMEFALTNVACCSRTFSASSGWRITAVQMSVRAVNASGAGVWSVPIIEGISYPVARPGAISGLRYDRSGSRIVWQPERVATAYDIEWKQSSSGTSRTVALCSNSDNTLSGSSCALQITRVRHEVLEYRVRAKNKNGTQFGSWSSWNTDEAETARPFAVPGAVTGVRWQSGRIVWQSASRATAYDVDWRYRGETATRQSVNCTSNCSLGISRDPTRTLEFRVRGKNGGGDGPWSSWANESAEVALPGEVPNIAYRRERIVWDPAPAAVAYDVEWKNEGQSATRDSVTCSSSCSHSVQRMAGKRLEFRVRGKNNAGRGPWSSWVHAAVQSRPSVPEAPRNIELSASSDGVLTISWDPPLSAGSSPITGYVRVVSRAEGTGTREFTRSRAYESRTATFRTLRDCTTYTVRIAAQNSLGIGKFVSATIHTGSNDPPPAPRNLSVETLEGEDNRIEATWDLPAGSSTCGLYFEIRWSRRDIDGDELWWTTEITTNRVARLKGLTGRNYDVSVRSLRNGKSSRREYPPDHQRDFIPLPRPIVQPIEHEERRLWDDPDALARWQPIGGANSYQLDWRYMEINSEELNVIYTKLQREDDSDERERLQKRAIDLLDGTEIPAILIEGDSAPNADPNSPEVHLHDSGMYSVFTREGQRSGAWNPKSNPIEFRIDDRNDDYVLQLRVRAVQNSWRGPWSDWTYHPNSRFSAGCQALEFYRNIKDALRAIEIAGWIITAAGVVTAVVTAGSSALAAQALRTIAVQFGRKIASDLAVKNVMRQIAKYAIESATETLRGNFLRFVFGCAGYAVDGGLSVENIEALGAAVIRESWSEISEDTDWTNIERDLLINALTG